MNAPLNFSLLMAVFTAFKASVAHVVPISLMSQARASLLCIPPALAITELLVVSVVCSFSRKFSLWNKVNIFGLGRSKLYTNSFTAVSQLLVYRFPLLWVNTKYPAKYLQFAESRIT